MVKVVVQGWRIGLAWVVHAEGVAHACFVDLELCRLMWAAPRDQGPLQLRQGPRPQPGPRLGPGLVSFPALLDVAPVIDARFLKAVLTVHVITAATLSATPRASTATVSA